MLGRRTSQEGVSKDDTPGDRAEHLAGCWQQPVKLSGGLGTVPKEGEERSSAEW